MELLRQTASEWQEDKVSRLAAALAYYTVLSIAPLMVILLAVAGMAYGEEAARGQITHQLRAAVGEQAGAAVETVLANAKGVSAGVVGTIVGALVLLFGASGVFGELQDSLNTIWGVAPRPGRGFIGVLKDRFASFTMVLGVAFLLLVSLVLSTVLSAIGDAVGRWLPGGAELWHLVNTLVSFAMISLLFALIFKVIPDVRVAWKDVVIGATATALLFTVGKFLLGLYLGRATVASPYGAAGSVVVLLIWVYYSAQILFAGAEFTQVYARRYGSDIEPARNAIPLPYESRVRQGMLSPEEKRQIVRELEQGS